MLAIKDRAPDFSLLDAQNKAHALAEALGQWVLLYFYPKDDTPGCTKEACAFRDHQSLLLEQGCVVYGVSRDSTESHQTFSEKYALNFSLLSDPDLSVHRAYGVLDEGKTIRATFLIDPKGSIAQVWPKVSVEGHAQEILVALKAVATTTVNGSH